MIDNPSRKALYMREYMRKYNKRKSDKLDGVKAGEYFIRQGDVADSMYLITKGKVEVQLELEEDTHKRLKTMMPGTIIGEMGIYTSSTRTASAKALVDTQLMKLSEKSLNNMEAHNQLMAVRLHRFVIMLLAERLGDSNKVLRELFD